MAALGVAYETLAIIARYLLVGRQNAKSSPSPSLQILPHAHPFPSFPSRATPDDTRCAASCSPSHAIHTHPPAPLAMPPPPPLLPKPCFCAPVASSSSPVLA